MEILCTRPNCPRPLNHFSDLDDLSSLKTAQQKYCTSCGMPLILAGRYLPSRLLGKGGFGAAFLARDRYTPTMRECVVKQFQPAGDLSPKQLETAQGLFEREAAVLEKLGNKHRQIPDLYAFFPLIVPGFHSSTENQFFYLVQEYINGHDLETELQQRGKFSEPEVLEVLEEILKVLKFVHENGSIHRDIKPSNIMRAHDGILFLLDFGAVKEVTASVGATPGRSTGIYSPGYAPPEQMHGSQVYPSTDLYALAVTCLNLLTGKPPEDLFDGYNNCWDWKPHAPQISDRLAVIFERMLQLVPKDRYDSAEEVLNALKTPPNLPQQPPPIPTQTSPVTPAKVPQPPPIPQPVQPVTPVVTTPRKSSNFSLIEILSHAAFTGFEGALLIIAAMSLIPHVGISIGLWGGTMGGLIFAQYRRLIEKVDLLIIAGISLGLVWFIPALHDIIAVYNLKLYLVVVIAVFTAAVMVSITAIFRLVYQLLSQVL